MPGGATARPEELFERTMLMMTMLKKKTMMLKVIKSLFAQIFTEGKSAA
jgi:hypothetical protein